MEARSAEKSVYHSVKIPFDAFIICMRRLYEKEKCSDQEKEERVTFELVG